MTCLLCGAATSDAVFEATGGLCTSCEDGIRDTIKMLPIRPGIDPDDRTVYVENYRPPVPGQLELPE